MNRQTGSIYMLTLASSLVLVAVVVGISFQILQFRRTSRSAARADDAQTYAELGIRLALRYTIDDPQWRSHLNNGLWLQNVSVGDAVYSVTGEDLLDGDLSDNAAEPVRLTCTATVAGSTRTVQVDAASKLYDLLNYAVACQGTLNMSNNVSINGNVTTNADVNISGSGAMVYGDAEAVIDINKPQYITGTVSTGVTPQSYPDFNTVVQYYSSRATAISYTSLIENILLSPTSNPYGVANPDGLYIIQCNNDKITIRNCRIVGTLLLIQPKSDSIIEVAINWQPARADYPALIIDGICTIAPEGDLNEADLNTDFSLPSESGAGSIADVYPNKINGLIYSSSDLVTDKIFSLQGTIIADGMVELKGNAAVTYDSAILTNPPIGFRHSYLQPIQSTWRQVLPATK